MKHRRAERGRIGGDEVERNRRHRNHHGSDEHDTPMDGQRAEDFRRRGPSLAGEELVRFLERPPEHQQTRNDGTADEKRDSPSPQRHFCGRQDGIQYDPQQSCEHDR